MVVQTIDIRPQPGFQEDFLSSEADIVIGGGSAGAGKTFALLLESSRHRDVAEFGAVIFRRTFPEIMQEGGLWDECFKLFPYFGARPNMTKIFWDFPSGARVSFKHLQHESDLLDYQGGQFALICFDEITHFSKKMFLYMMSRNRSTCGVRPYIRATCNPDPDSFVAELIEWFIDQDEESPTYGLPIPERCGLLRWFIVDGDSYVFGNSPEEVISKCPHIFNTQKLSGLNARDLVKSITFIPGNIHENHKLLDADPGYLANLLSQDTDTKSRLYEGNWKVRLDNMMLFEYPKISDIFTNVLPPVPREGHYITIDHARFGRDLCVITAWIGWRAVEMHVLTKSDTNDILRVVRGMRIKYKPIPASNIICDQDGIGVIDALNCVQFHGGAKPFKENNTNNKEEREREKLKTSGKKIETRYRNRKTEFYFYLSNRVNAGDILVNMDNIFVDGRLAKTIKLKGKTYEIKQLIRDDLRVVKRIKVDRDVIEITDKAAMKAANGGRSQDFGDNLMLRSHFDLAPTIKYAKTA